MLQVSDTAAVTTNPAVEEAIKASIAELAGVGKELVKLIFEVFKPANTGRRLASGQIKCDYTITVPTSGAIASQSSLQHATVADTTLKINQNIKKAVPATTLKTEAVSKTPVSSKVVEVTTAEPTTAAPTTTKMKGTTTQVAPIGATVITHISEAVPVGQLFVEVDSQVGFAIAQTIVIGEGTPQRQEVLISALTPAAPSATRRLAPAGSISFTPATASAFPPGTTVNVLPSPCAVAAAQAPPAARLFKGESNEAKEQTSPITWGAMGMFSLGFMSIAGMALGMRARRAAPVQTKYHALQPTLAEDPESLHAVREMHRLEEGTEALE